MRRFLAAVAVLLGLAAPALADGTIDTLSAGGAIAGTELIPMFQTANPAVSTTPNALDTYLSATSKALTNKTINCASNTCTVRIGSDVSGLGTGVATALGVNVGSAGAFVVNGGALGTPSSGTATNLTGTASGLTAGTVTTNANLTGPITSSGNATSIASQTGTGTKFVVDTSPTLVTPNLGTPSAAVLTNATGLPIAGITGLGTGVATALGAATNGSTGMVAGLTPTNNNCVVGNGSAWTSASCPGGGSVSVTAGTPNVVITPSPGTGTFTVGSTNVQNSPADGGSHSYTVLSGDATKEVILASTFTALAVPQATGSFAAGYSFTGVNKGALTATSTSSTVNGIAGATGIKLGANQFSSWDSDGANWLVGLGVPQPATQTGTTFLRDDMTWATPAGAGNVSTSGTLTSGKIVIGQGTTTVDVDASAGLSSGALTLGASGTAGSVAMGNATSGTVTLQPVTGALGSVTASLPANTGTVAELNLSQAWTAGQAVTPTAGGNTGTATVTPDAATSNGFTYTLTGNITLANPSNVKAGQVLNFQLTQDGSGGKTIALGSQYKFAGATAPTWSTGAGKIDVLSCWFVTTSVGQCNALIDVR